MEDDDSLPGVIPSTSKNDAETSSRMPMPVPVPVPLLSFFLDVVIAVLSSRNLAVYERVGAKCNHWTLPESYQMMRARK